MAASASMTALRPRRDSVVPIAHPLAGGRVRRPMLTDGSARRRTQQGRERAARGASSWIPATARRTLTLVASRRNGRARRVDGPALTRLDHPGAESGHDPGQSPTADGEGEPDTASTTGK